MKNVKKGIVLWYVVGYLREAWGKTGEELPDSWKVGKGNIYESMEEYLPLDVIVGKLVLSKGKYMHHFKTMFLLQHTNYRAVL